MIVGILGGVLGILFLMSYNIMCIASTLEDIRIEIKNKRL